jgi:hypothetical protein
LRRTVQAVTAAVLVTLVAFAAAAVTATAHRARHRPAVNVAHRTKGLSPKTRAVAFMSLATVELPPVVTTPVKTPPVKAPPVKVPPVKTPPVKVPPVTTPPVKVPPITTPPVKVPPVKAPPVKVPAVKLPPVTTPPVKVPAIKTPAVKVPSVKTPPVTIPTSPAKAPPVKAPAVKAPSVKVPSVKAPAAKSPSASPTIAGRLPSAPSITLPSPEGLARAETAVSSATSRAEALLEPRARTARTVAPLARTDSFSDTGDTVGSAAGSREALLSILGGSVATDDGSGYSGPEDLPDLARLLAEGHGRLDHARLRAFVLLLEGCVPGLSPELRYVLRLRSGLHQPHSLSTRTIAIRLHTSPRHVRMLEVRGLRRLLHLARTTGCATTTEQVTPASAVFASYVPGAASTPTAAFGVESAREEQLPAGSGPSRRSGRPPASTLLGLRAMSSAWWLLVAGLLALLLVALGVLDNLGFGPRHRYRGGLKRRK